jgi:hypothetical protein
MNTFAQAGQAGFDSLDNMRELRPNASKQPAIRTANRTQRVIQKTLHAAGNIVTFGNKWNLTPYQLRQAGAVILTAAAVAPVMHVARPVVRGIVSGAEYEMDSNIPTSEAHINSRLDVIEPIPSTGAFDFAESTDPDHNPEQGVYNFTRQLHGQAPEPGDLVAVPRPGASK